MSNLLQQVTFRRALVAGAAVLMLFSVASVAVGRSHGKRRQAIQSVVTATPPLQSPRPMSTAVSGAFGTFQAGAADQDGGEKLRDAFARGPAESNVAHADFAQAIAVPIQGSTLTAWIAPSGDQVCTFVPDPSHGGIAATCSSLAQARAGKGLLVVPQGPDAAAIAVLAPDGATPPEIRNSAGGAHPIRVQSNLAAALVPAAGDLVTASARVDLARPESPPDQG
jgi:hypothetical protein